MRRGKAVYPLQDNALSVREDKKCDRFKSGRQRGTAGSRGGTEDPGSF